MTEKAETEASGGRGGGSRTEKNHQHRRFSRRQGGGWVGEGTIARSTLVFGGGQPLAVYTSTLQTLRPGCAMHSSGSGSRPASSRRTSAAGVEQRGRTGGGPAVSKAAWLPGEQNRRRQLACIVASISGAPPGTAPPTGPG